MPFTKNQIITLEIKSISNDGNGVAHKDGQAVFVPLTAPGDIAEVRIVKPMKSYAFGRVERLLAPGPDRIRQDCPVAGPCGGCGLRHIRYEAECAAKTQFVRDAFARIGKLDVPVREVLAAPAADRYRNKVQLPVGTDENGHIVTGFFAGRSHRIVACADCRLQPEWMNQLAARTCTLLEENGITAYNEETHTGRVRHLYMRQGWHSGQRLLCFVVNGNGLPNEAEICATLQKEFALTTILVNRNSERTNVILGRKTRTVLGPGVIEDTLAGVPLRMGVHEFYQVNTPAAETLYAKAREYAGLKETDFLLDLYCGMGTIGLSMLPDCRRLVGGRAAGCGRRQTDSRPSGAGCRPGGFPLSGCRCGSRTAGRRGCPPRCDRGRPAAQGLRRGRPDRHCRDGPPHSGHGQLQCSHRRTRHQMADRAWLQGRRGAAGGPLPPNAACRMYCPAVEGINKFHW